MPTPRIASMGPSCVLPLAVVLLLGVSIAPGCAGDLPEAAQQQADSYVPPVPDQSLWPDSASGGQDGAGSWDTYSGSPFGCQQDSDCFGLRCCATPWGVKLCASSCTE